MGENEIRTQSLKKGKKQEKEHKKVGQFINKMTEISNYIINQNKSIKSPKNRQIVKLNFEI